MFGFGDIERGHRLNYTRSLESKLRIANHASELQHGTIGFYKGQVEALETDLGQAFLREVALELRLAGTIAIIDLLEGAVTDGRRLPREAGRETSSVAGSPERRAIYIAAVRKRAGELVAAEKSAEWHPLILKTAEEILLNRGAIAKAGGPAI